MSDFSSPNYQASDYDRLLIEHFYASLRQNKLQLKDGQEEREYKHLKSQASRKLLTFTGLGSCSVLALDQYLGRKVFKGAFPLPRIALLVVSTAAITYTSSQFAFSPRQAELAAVLANRYEEELLTQYADLKALYRK
jgi:hypothetical protein